MRTNPGADRQLMEEQQGQELTEHDRAVVKDVFGWMQDFLRANGVHPGRLVDFARYYRMKHGRVPALTLAVIGQQIKDERYEVPDIQERAV